MSKMFELKSTGKVTFSSYIQHALYHGVIDFKHACALNAVQDLLHAVEVALEGLSPMKDDATPAQHQATLMLIAALKKARGQEHE